MADQTQVALLTDSVERWNDWRRRNPGVSPDLRDSRLINRDLSRANLDRADMRGADLSKAQLSHATLHGANLESATFIMADLLGAVLNSARLSGASFFGALLFGTRMKSTDCSGANFLGSSLMGADLGGALLKGAHLAGANLQEANLAGADLTGADLTAASLVGTRVMGAKFSHCTVYGISTWGLEGDPAVQEHLIITPKGGIVAVVDDLETALLVNLLLYGRRFHRFLDKGCQKLVVLLARRKVSSDELQLSVRREVAALGYLPVLVDLDRPGWKAGAETIRRLLSFARFAVLDLTGLKSGGEILTEISEVCPELPLQPVETRASSGQEVPGTRTSWRRNVLELYAYRDSEDLSACLRKRFAGPAGG